MWPMISPTHFVFGFSIKRFFVIIMFKVVNRIKVYEIDMDERSFLWKKSCNCVILNLRFYRLIMNMLANCAILW